MKKTAIILGATGLTGTVLLKKLIEDDRYDRIKLFSRSKIEGLPQKVTQFIVDLLKLDECKADFDADEVYCCIGTTAKKTPNKHLYTRIDHGIPVAAAKLSRENSITTFLVISAMGAHKKSSIFYNKTKGQMEYDVLQQNIKNTFVLRPSLIGGDRADPRPLEKIGLTIFKVIAPFLFGKLKQYKIISPESIAQAMIYLANNTDYPEVIVPSNEIKEFVKLI
jgi:uncharacterized protein YbjT (DUF2867 family)